MSVIWKGDKQPTKPQPGEVWVNDQGQYYVWTVPNGPNGRYGACWCLLSWVIEDHLEIHGSIFVGGDSAEPNDDDAFDRAMKGI